MQASEYLKLSPIELLNVLTDTFVVQIPENGIQSVDDMNSIAQMLTETTNSYSFLMQLASLAKLQCREISRHGSKAEKEDSIDKKEIVNNIVHAVEHRMKTLSRLITIKQEINREMNYQ